MGGCAGCDKVVSVLSAGRRLCVVSVPAVDPWKVRSKCRGAPRGPGTPLCLEVGSVVRMERAQGQDSLNLFVTGREDKGESPTSPSHDANHQSQYASPDWILSRAGAADSRLTKIYFSSLRVSSNLQKKYPAFACRVARSIKKFRQRQQLGRAFASLLAAADTLHKSRRAVRTHPQYADINVKLPFV